MEGDFQKLNELVELCDDIEKFKRACREKKQRLGKDATKDNQQDPLFLDRHFRQAA